MKILTLIIMVSLSPVHATSLFNDEIYESIVSQEVKHNVGDLLTVLIYESSTASNTALTDTSTTVDIGLSHNDGSNPGNKGLDANNDFEGGGKVNRTGKVIASMSVSIMMINDNGNYQITGEQNILLNNESQFIRVSGTIRPEDISSDNSVLSTRIANADIEFKGQGILSTTEKPGYITRFFNWLF